jgi:glutathione peroxidase
MKKFITAIFIFLNGVSAMAADKTLFDFSLIGNDGKPMPLAQFKGKVVLLVNTASECGFTPQYEGLEKLWEAKAAQGLVIIGVPSNDFGAQEPGSAGEIATFCKLNYGVTFPLADKAVVSGTDAVEVYKWAGEFAGALGRPKWNFHKYLFGRDGKFIDWFASTTEPMSDKITHAVEMAVKSH